SVTVSWAIAASAPNTAAMVGSDGRNMSMDRAPSPTTAVSTTSTRTPVIYPTRGQSGRLSRTRAHLAAEEPAHAHDRNAARGGRAGRDGGHGSGRGAGPHQDRLPVADLGGHRPGREG